MSKKMKINSNTFSFTGEKQIGDAVNSSLCPTLDNFKRESLTMRKRGDCIDEPINQVFTPNYRLRYTLGILHAWGNYGFSHENVTNKYLYIIKNISEFLMLILKTTKILRENVNFDNFFKIPKWFVCWFVFRSSFEVQSISCGIFGSVFNYSVVVWFRGLSVTRFAAPIRTLFLLAYLYVLRIVAINRLWTYR